MSIRWVLVIVLVGCGPKGTPKSGEVQPVDPLPEHATIKPPGGPTGPSVHLTCDGRDDGAACQAIDFTFDATYDQPMECRWGGDGNLNFTMGSSRSQSARLQIHLEPFNGAGTYQFGSGASRAAHYVVASESVNIPAVGNCRANTITAGLRSPQHTCEGCSAIVTEDPPSGAYPKTLKISVACQNLCKDDVYVCTPAVNFQVQQTCTK